MRMNRPEEKGRRRTEDEVVRKIPVEERKEGVKEAE